MSVDGTHFPIEEPQPYSTKWSSHKLGGKPGLNYEIGLSIFDSKLLWIHGPTPPGRYNDITVFRSHLKDKIPNGRRVIADLGYRGEVDIVSTKNEFDPHKISEFKDRVMVRHETFNKRIKIFGCMSNKFRHGVKNHKDAFEAICVPSFILHNSEELFRKEDSRCDRMEQAHNVHANKLLADINNQVKTVLLVFQSGVVCTPYDSTSKEGKVKIAIHSLTMDHIIGKNRVDTAHNYFPTH